MRAVYLLLMLELGWIVGITKGAAQNRQANEIADDVSDGMEVATQIAEGVFNVLADSKMTKLVSVFGAAPMLGAVMGIVTMFMPDATEIALNEIKGKLDTVEERLNGLSTKLDNLEDKVEIENYFTRINDPLSDITSAYTAYTAFASFNNSKNEDHLKSFYENDDLLKNQITKLYLNVNGEIAGTTVLADQLYDSFDGHYMDIFAVYMRIQTVITRGIAVWTLGCKLSKGDNCERLAYQIMGPMGDNAYHKTFSTSFQEALKKCRSNYVENRKADTMKLTDENRDITNEEMAEKIATFVRAKYFWKEQSVLVWNDMSEKDKFMANTNGFSLPNQNKRSVMILDGDTVPYPFNPSTTTKIGREFGTGDGLFGKKWSRNTESEHLQFYTTDACQVEKKVDCNEDLQNAVSEKGIKKSQTAVIMTFYRRKDVFGFWSTKVKEEDVELGSSISKNCQMFQPMENLRWSGLRTNFYFVVQLDGSREFEDICTHIDAECRSETEKGMQTCQAQPDLLVTDACQTHQKNDEKIKKDQERVSAEIAAAIAAAKAKREAKAAKIAEEKAKEEANAKAIAKANANEIAKAMANFRAKFG